MECQISEIIQVCFNVINDMQTLSDRVEYLLQGLAPIPEFFKANFILLSDDTICLEETTIAHNITSSSSLALIDDHVLKPSDSLMSNMRPTKIPRTTRSQMSSNHTKNLQKIQTIEDIEQIRNENKANNTQTTMTDELFNSTFVKSSSNLKSKKEKPKNDISVFDFDPNSPDLETSDTRFRFFKSRSRPNGTNTRANTNKPDIQKKPTNTPKPKLKANVRKKKDTTSPIVRNLRSRACKKK